MISNNNQNQIKTTVNDELTTNNEVSNDLTYELTVDADDFFKVPGLTGTVKFIYWDDTQATLSDVSLEGEDLNLTIPSDYTPSGSDITYTISAIGGHAFESCTSLESISIPM